MSTLLWGFLPDSSSRARFIRGLLISVLTYITDATAQGQAITLRSVLLAALGFFAGWLRAGEQNDPRKEREGE